MNPSPNPMLEFLRGLLKKGAEKIDSADQAMPTSVSYMPDVSPAQAPDAALMLQNDLAQAGIENEAAGFLRPAPPIMDVPQFSYQPQQPQPPQETERERMLREETERIRRGEAPPPIPY